MKINFKLAIVCLTLISILLLNGCNTAKGFGEDLEKGGQKIQQAAES